MDSETLLGWVIFGGFISGWLFFAIYGIKKGWSKTISIGGGLIASCMLLIAVALPFAPSQPTVEPTKADSHSATNASTLTFNAITISSFFAAGSIMIYCERLSDAQALTVGDTVKYMAEKGGISRDETKTAVVFGATVADEDLKANGGCAGPNFKDYERNYYEYINDPALAHLQIKGSPAPRAAQISPNGTYASHYANAVLEGLINSPLCDQFHTMIERIKNGSNPDNVKIMQIDRIIDTADKYRCLIY